MKRLLVAAALAAAVPVFAADVGVSVQISQPGVFGRIDIGRFPQPQVFAPQPVIVSRVGGPPPEQPVYMWVPPEHRRDWRHHCAAYGACRAPVVFVRDEWYREHVHPHGRDGGRGEWRAEGRGDGRGEHRRDGRGEGRGEGRDGGHPEHRGPEHRD
jgi:hypothetical protein